ncbi:nitroreductase family deazaflavin-dependent oxidoreductase [Spongiactinospora gelatinilytica]|uniref:Nitroreductase family deazaflavin-dependent oxidoreductase n=1 Tax=Spongiactinospora gelatinilytica TaxID=2666298 RepID=A0A2W2GU96_9ACTN|nr:nitroreductase/quinone reductase family protein [Spongiactinospora gelatinilytica]PZG40888.1 nitroreductase family deazaflavin-dependent oxidoreductase [Spongiactinospora gelatinilytica]
MPIDFNQQIIDEFRANDGRVGGPFEDARLLLLTTTGARSGARHTTPVGYLPDGGRMLIIGSAGGSPRHPAWYHDLLADPVVTVETGAFTFRARAAVLEGAERDAIFARAVEADPGWAEYQAKTTRVIPVVALTPIDDEPGEDGPGGPASLGEMLRKVHESFRTELLIIRKEIAASGPVLGAQLRVNCLTMCQNLTVHHGHEDNGMFPALDRSNPELAPALARLREEHEVVARLLDDLKAVLAADAPEPAVLAGEVERLTTDLLAHLDYEEEQLLPILNKFTF